MEAGYKVAWWFMVVSAILTLFMAKRGVARQMCWSCQYQKNAIGMGKECINAPGNWTGGPQRRRCPELCITDARYDSFADVTFITRGCAIHDRNRRNGCQKFGDTYICIFTCEGVYYCNGQNMEQLKHDPDEAASFACGWSNLLLWTILTCMVSAVINIVMS